MVPPLAARIKPSPRASSVLLLTRQVSGDGLITPELDLDIGFRWPGGPGLVVALPAWVRNPELLDEAGQFADEEHAPVIGPGLVTDPELGPEAHGGEAVRVGDAGLGQWQCGHGQLNL